MLPKDARQGQTVRLMSRPPGEPEGVITGIIKDPYGETCAIVKFKDTGYKECHLFSNLKRIFGFDWPEWVPEAIRKEIELSHADAQAWQENSKMNQAPEFGSEISLMKFNDEYCQPGRFVHAWNNIGRIVHEDGSYDYVWFVRP